MSDQNWRDDILKLVQYKILFLKRDYAYAFPEQEGLGADNIDAAAYTTWQITDKIKFWLTAYCPTLRLLGIARLGRDVFHLSGQIGFAPRQYMAQIILNRAEPLAKGLVTALRVLLESEQAPLFWAKLGS